MILDCFLFYNEFDLLEIRLNELYNFVDKFLIIESATTFAGNKNNNFIFQFKDFEKFKDKIISIRLNYKPNSVPMTNEIYQRNFIGDYLANQLKISKSDLIMISDLDEIPNNKFFNGNNVIDSSTIYTLTQKCYYYYLNLLCTNQSWGGTKVFRGNVLIDHNLKCDDIRHQRHNLRKVEIYNDGWHFTYMGGKEKILDKITNFSHCDYVQKNNLNLETIESKTENMSWLFNDGANLTFKEIKIDESYPKYILENIEKFKHLIK